MKILNPKLIYYKILNPKLFHYKFEKWKPWFIINHKNLKIIIKIFIQYQILNKVKLKKQNI